MQIKRGGGGFTLAELLIVMAIIVVLAAVAIPTFGRQLETARETGDMELIRNAYNEALSMAVLDGADGELNGLNGSTTSFSTAVHGVRIIAETTTETNPAYDADTNPDVPQTITKGTGNITVEVRLAEALKQTEKKWQYVRGDIMSTQVGDNTDHPASGDLYATFKFKLGEDGSVKLDTSTPIVLSDTAAA